MTQPHNSHVLKTVGAISIGVWIVASTVLWYHYAGTRPHALSPATGNVYPLNTHGSVVYLRLIDCVILYGTLTSAFIVAVVVWVVELRRNGWMAPTGRRW